MQCHWEAGVDAIVSGVVHAIPAVKTVDVTDRLVKRFEPSENTLKTIEEMKKVPPLGWEEFPIED